MLNSFDSLELFQTGCQRGPGSQGCGLGLPAAMLGMVKFLSAGAWIECLYKEFLQLSVPHVTDTVKETGVPTAAGYLNREITIFYNPTQAHCEIKSANTPPSRIF